MRRACPQAGFASPRGEDSRLFSQNESEQTAIYTIEIKCLRHDPASLHEYRLPRHFVETNCPSFLKENQRLAEGPPSPVLDHRGFREAVGAPSPLVTFAGWTRQRSALGHWNPESDRSDQCRRWSAHSSILGAQCSSRRPAALFIGVSQIPSGATDLASKLVFVGCFQFALRPKSPHENCQLQYQQHQPPFAEPA
jgi:hypothetical protein